MEEQAGTGALDATEAGGLRPDAAPGQGGRREPHSERPAGRSGSGRRLPLSVKLCFGAPSFAGAAMAIPIAVHMPKFYSDVVLAPLGAVALAIALARSLDALTDPLMGWLSDRTRTRWGRRKPWMALGVPFTAVAFVALFSPPESLTPEQAAVWFGVSFMLYFLFATIYEIPHGALGAELSLDYHERSSLFAIRVYFIQPGLIIAAAAPVVLQEILGPGRERQVFSGVAIAFAALLVALYALLLWRVPERPEFARREANPLVPGVRRALRNRPFRILFLAGLTNAIPAAIPAVLLPFLVEYVLQPQEPMLWLGIYLGILFLTGACFVPVWLALSRRIGKLGSFVVASGVGIAGSVMFFFLGPGDLLPAAGLFFLIGTQSAVGTFLLPAMGADTIDYDELLTGKRREAQFGSFWAILPKFVSIPGSSIPIAALAAVGYMPNEAQNEVVLFTIRFLVAIFPAAFFVIALTILLRYPITEAVHEEIRAALAAHRRGETARDPVTGRQLPPPDRRGVDEQTGWFLDSFSPGELRRMLARGTGALRTSVLLSVAGALTLTLAAGALALASASGPETEPGLTTVFAVVAAGLSLTGLLFHLMRVGPARRMGRSPVDPDVVRAHLDELES